jgi:hypothetical protein
VLFRLLAAKMGLGRPHFVKSAATLNLKYTRRFDARKGLATVNILLLRRCIILSSVQGPGLPATHYSFSSGNVWLLERYIAYTSLQTTYTGQHVIPAYVCQDESNLITTKNKE